MFVDLKDFENAFAEIIESQATMLLRMRLRCAIHDADGRVVDTLEEMGKRASTTIRIPGQNANNPSIKQEVKH